MPIRCPPWVFSQRYEQIEDYFRRLAAATPTRMLARRDG